MTLSTIAAIELLARGRENVGGGGPHDDPWFAVEPCALLGELLIARLIGLLQYREEEQGQAPIAHKVISL